MPCPEHQRLASISDSKCQAYAYIRLNEKKVRFSKEHYDTLVKEGYATMTAALKEVAWHKLKCSACRQEAAK